jgi:hypothetical protein
MTKMKLLFTCPHGGQNDDGTTTNPPIIKRVTIPHGNDCPAAEGEGFKNVNDSLTLELTTAIVQNITKLSGKGPYAVYAEYNRRWIDYNRKEICAYEPTATSNPKAQEKYLKYHNDILQIIEEILPQGDNSMAFLFDIHGTDQEKSPEHEHPRRFIELLVGTDQTNSRKALTDADFWDEEKALIPLLRTKNIRAYPQDLSQEMNKFSLDGGYTIKEYGSKRIKPGLVAIQIEVINCIRDNRYCREKFAADMADCILKFVSPFIPT